MGNNGIIPTDQLGKSNTTLNPIDRQDITHLPWRKKNDFVRNQGICHSITEDIIKLTI